MEQFYLEICMKDKKNQYANRVYLNDSESTEQNVDFILYICVSVLYEY